MKLIGFIRIAISSIFLVLVLVLNLVGIVACDHANPSKTGLPEVYSKVEFQTKSAQINLHPKVDILFVIDNSKSMDVHQAKLSENIDSFVQSFSENETLDYHIGVVSIFDSTRYGSAVKSFTPNGQLRPMEQVTDGLPTYYYTKAHNNSDILRQMLKVGVILLDDGGPEKEESFSPVKAALSDPIISSVSNAGFYRSDAHLVVIFITDASDASPNLSAEQLYDFLWQLKGKDASKLHIYGVLADRNDKECINVDPSLRGDKDQGVMNSGKPDNIIDLISISQGRKLSICQENYGPMLSAMGREIEVKTSKQIIYLDSIPELSTLCISKVGDEKHKCIRDGWKYDPVGISIIFDNLATVVKQVNIESNSDNSTNIQLEISFTPIKIQNVINGRTKRQN